MPPLPLQVSAPRLTLSLPLPGQVRAMSLEFEGAPLKLEPKLEYVARKVGSSPSQRSWLVLSELPCCWQRYSTAGALLRGVGLLHW